MIEVTGSLTVDGTGIVTKAPPMPVVSLRQETALVAMLNKAAGFGVDVDGDNEDDDDFFAAQVNLCRA